MMKVLTLPRAIENGDTIRERKDRKSGYKAW